MRKNKFSSHTIKSLRRAQSVRRAPFLFLSFSALFLLLSCSFGCAPPLERDGDGKQSSSAAASSAPNDLPELTDEMIRELINYRRIREIPEENGAAEPIGWTFVENEPKEVVVVDKQMEGNRATIVLDIKTKSAPNARNPRFLAGQIRTSWELKTGWALRQWEIVGIENISMKFKNLPKPPESNSNR